ncbi:hypothetical protein M422DRAFT_179904, partial [Sphaerobolus stellatus SS14]
QRFQRSGDLRDITEAIAAWQLVVEMTPKRHARLPNRLSNLGNLFLSRFKRSGDLTDINEAIAAQQRALELTPDGHADLPTTLSNLGGSFLARYRRSGHLPHLTEAVAAQQRAVELAPDGHADLPAMLSNLGNSLLARFGRSGDLPDITEAVTVQQRAVELAPDGHADLPAMLSNLGNSLLARFGRSGDLPDITEAITVQQRAVELTPEGHVHLPGRLTDLGNSFRGRFEHSRYLPDITEAIAAQQKAVGLTPEGHASLPALLDSLGFSFMRRFERSGDLPDINEAIAAQQRAVELTSEGHADQVPGLLTNLGNSLMRRFQRSGDLPDITEAISCLQRAVELAPDGHADLPTMLSNLGNSFFARFGRTGDLPDITEAITVQQRAVELTPDGHADLPALLNNIGCSFSKRSERSSDLADIAEAIAAHRRAAELTPERHADLPGRLTNLGISFSKRFKRSGDLPDITEAITVLQRAVELTPDGHADLPGMLSGLGTSFLARFERSGDLADITEAIAMQQRATAATCHYGPPRSRLAAARRWASQLHQYYPNSPDVLIAFDCAIGLVTLVAGLEQTIRSRHLQLQDVSNLALQAAAAACALNRPDKALEWLEQGRCLVWGQLNSLRTPMDDLSQHEPDLARRIMTSSLEDQARSHVYLAREWDTLLEKARAIPGFESFLKPSPCASLLQHLPESGPVVVVNVYDDRCDAIALLAGLDEPFHIPLPNLSFSKVDKYRRALQSTLKENGLRKLDSSSSNVLPPRIFWCPTGPLSFLPIHAAGIYGEGKCETLLDYAVSSYTPTITALTDRVKNPLQLDKNRHGLFLTSQPNAPGASSISGTTREVESIFERASTNVPKGRMVQGSALTVDDCLKNMETFSSIHLACHGSQNAAEPLQCRFLFHNGSLPLAKILQANLKHADLAFLSACQTSTGDELLSDEAVHLAAGMLAAGYRRVVGTMWSIADEPAKEIAEDFYDYLWTHREDGGEGESDMGRSAYALHNAIQKIRLRLDNSERSLLTWIPYVLFGY